LRAGAKGGFASPKCGGFLPTCKACKHAVAAAVADACKRPLVWAWARHKTARQGGAGAGM